MFRSLQNKNFNLNDSLDIEEKENKNYLQQKHEHINKTEGNTSSKAGEVVAASSKNNKISSLSIKSNVGKREDEIRNQQRNEINGLSNGIDEKNDTKYDNKNSFKGPENIVDGINELKIFDPKSKSNGYKKGIYITCDKVHQIVLQNEPLILELDIINNTELVIRLLEVHMRCATRLIKPIDELYEIKSRCKYTITVQVDTSSNLGYNTEDVLVKFAGKINDCWYSIHYTVKEDFYIDYKNLPKKIKNKTKDKQNFVREAMFTFRPNVTPGIRPVEPPKFVPVQMSFYNIPKEILELNVYLNTTSMSKEQFYNELYKAMPSLKEDLSYENYKQKFSELLYLEEMEMLVAIKKYDSVKVFTRKGDYLCVNVNDTPEERFLFAVGDRVLVNAGDRDKTDCHRNEGYIHKIKKGEIFLQFHEQFHKNYNGEKYYVKFVLSRSVMRKFHEVVNVGWDEEHLGKEFLFPTEIEYKPPHVLIRSEDGKLSRATATHSNHDKPKWNKKGKGYGLVTSIEPGRKEIKERESDLTWINSEQLNNNQKQAIRNILEAKMRPLPYIIHGPPGTGKTVTLVETILQILLLIPESRILIATPSNSSANLIAEKLVDSNVLKPNDLLRLIGFNLAYAVNISPKIRHLCATGDLNANSGVDKTNDLGRVNYATREVIAEYRIVIGTSTGLGILYNMGFPNNHFTHVIMDEAGQMTEPESLIPLVFFDRNCGLAVLAGDPKQLGPVVTSRTASSHGFGVSLMMRLLDNDLYYNPESGYNTALVSRLQHNYRSLPEILSLPSKMYYNSSLIPTVDNYSSEQGKFLAKLADVLPERENGTPPAIIFHGVRGIERQETSSYSYHNMEEISLCVFYLEKLYKKGVEADDVGIISPYRGQVYYLRQRINSLGLPMPKMGSVEEFQGQEKNVIIISTVRSVKHVQPQNANKLLAFISTKQRINVALTRAKSLLVIVGNTLLLNENDEWRKVLKYCIQKEGYEGCNLPYELLK